MSQVSDFIVMTSCFLINNAGVAGSYLQIFFMFKYGESGHCLKFTKLPSVLL